MLAPPEVENAKRRRGERARKREAGNKQIISCIGGTPTEFVHRLAATMPVLSIRFVGLLANGRQNKFTGIGENVYIEIDVRSVVCVVHVCKAI